MEDVEFIAGESGIMGSWVPGGPPSRAQASEGQSPTLPSVEIPDLQRALLDLEHAAAAPVVSGGLSPWIIFVRNRLVRLAREYESSIDEALEILAEVTRLDASLSARCESLRARVQAHPQEIAAYIDAVDVLEQSCAPLSDWHELRRELIAWAAVFRADEREIRCWLVEASYRDNGGRQ